MARRQYGARRQEIERLADDLRREIWRRRKLLWSDGSPKDEVSALEPGVALEMLGYQVRSVDYLGVHNIDGKQSEVAGTIDQYGRTVEISRRFPNDVQLFTAAHELAHVVLHPDVRQLHRDVAPQGVKFDRPWREQEADFFAACFLMPADMIADHFFKIFGTQCFELSDDTAFGLCTSSLEVVLRKFRRQRDLSHALAQANSYFGVPVAPLHRVFQVSGTAMAIRLEELGLVGELPHAQFAPAFLKR